MSSKSLKYSALLAACLGAAALAGCGSSNKGGSSALVNVGDTGCVQCHSAVTEALTGQSIITQYENSSPHNAAGLGCESCHGSGGLHNGVGPIPYPQPDAARCATCHDGTTAVATNSATAFADSRHNTQSVRDSANCKRCHSHEGAILSNINGLTGDNAVLTNVTYQNRVPLANSYSQINCATCHEHGAGLRTIKATDASGNIVNWDPNNNRRIDQFDLCTSCHTMYNYNGSQLLADGNPLNGVATGVNLHAATSARWYGVLTTTHFDNYSTGPQATGNANTKVEGYVLRRTTDNACFDCHGHESKTNTRNEPSRGSTIHTDWAKSAHAGGLLNAKYTAVGALTGANAVGPALNAYVDDNTAIAWTHYNWDNSTGNPSSNADPDRKSCQRCHTATGAANFMNNPAGYDPANNDFSHLQGWTSTRKTSKQNELLYCWGCHTNAGTGELRNPGAITETYAPGTAGDPATTVAYPDIAGSNVCMTCHLGRETGQVIKNDQDADGVRGFVNSHYLAAGGQLFGTTGYEYDGVSYANPSYFAHDKIGSAAAPGTGSNGPCAGCHMTTPNSHSFNNVAKDNAGVITALTSTSCVTCHDGTHGTALTAGSAAAATFLETEKEHYHAALDALEAALKAKGIYFAPENPYFFNDTNASGVLEPAEIVRANAFTNWAGVTWPGVTNTATTWKNVMGAAFNYNLLHHDPGGYAHNRIYSKRLIFDAIDFIDNGVLDGVITVAGDAATYLDGNAATAGVQRP